MVVREGSPHVEEGVGLAEGSPRETRRRREWEREGREVSVSPPTSRRQIS